MQRKNSRKHVDIKSISEESIESQQSSEVKVQKRKSTQPLDKDDEVKTEINKAKKKKYKKRDDGGYRPGKFDPNRPNGLKKPNTNVNQTGSFPHMLYDCEKSFTDPDGKEVAIKTSVMIDYDALVAHAENKNIDWADMCEQLFTVFNTIPSFRPAVPNEYSKNKSPVKLKTPEKGTELSREKKIGFLSFYSNRPNVIPLENVKSQTKIDPDSDFFSSSSYEAILTVNEIIKKQNEIITSELLKKTKKENAMNGTSRSQNIVMVNEGINASEGSAQKHADATKLFSIGIPMEWQWLHLIAHFIWGEDSQIPENLIVGSKEGNRDMDSVENQLRYLAKKYPEGFELVVEADLIEGTHVGVSMRYFIKTKDFLLPFEFDVQTPNAPHISQPDYIRKFVRTLVEKCKETPQPQAKKKINFQDKQDKFPFFTREEKETEIQTTTSTQQEDKDKTKIDIVSMEIEKEDELPKEKSRP